MTWRSFSEIFVISKCRNNGHRSRKAMRRSSLVPKLAHCNIIRSNCIGRCFITSYMGTSDGQISKTKPKYFSLDIKVKKPGRSFNPRRRGWSAGRNWNSSNLEQFSRVKKVILFTSSPVQSLSNRNTTFFRCFWEVKKLNKLLFREPEFTNVAWKCSRLQK